MLVFLWMVSITAGFISTSKILFPIESLIIIWAYLIFSIISTNRDKNYLNDYVTNGHERKKLGLPVWSKKHEQGKPNMLLLIIIFIVLISCIIYIIKYIL